MSIPQLKYRITEILAKSRYYAITILDTINLFRNPETTFKPLFYKNPLISTHSVILAYQDKASCSIAYQWVAQRAHAYTHSSHRRTQMQNCCARAFHFNIAGEQLQAERNGHRRSSRRKNVYGQYSRNRHVFTSFHLTCRLLLLSKML